MKWGGSGVVVVDYSLGLILRTKTLGLADLPAQQRGGFLSALEVVGRPAICTEALPGLPLVTLVSNCCGYNCHVRNSMTSWLLKGSLQPPHHLIGFFFFFFWLSQYRKVTFHPTVETFGVTPNSFIFVRLLHLHRHVWVNSRHPSWFCPIGGCNFLSHFPDHLSSRGDSEIPEAKHCVTSLLFSFITVHCRATQDPHYVWFQAGQHSPETPGCPPLLPSCRQLLRDDSLRVNQNSVTLPRP